MKTEITELLGIEYPVIQGGMAWVAECHLASSRIQCRRSWTDRSRRSTGRMGKRADPGNKKTDR